MEFRTVSHMVFLHKIKYTEYFTDGTNIPWNPPTIHCPDLIAAIQQMSLFHSAHCSLSNPMCFRTVWRWRAMIPGKFFTRICQIPRNCQCKWLLVSSSAPGASLGSSGSPEKSLFCTGRIVTTELPNLAPQQRIDDFYVIHFLHWDNVVIRSY